MSYKRILSARPVLESIREGLSREQLMQKHGLSPAGLRTVLKQIQEERDRRACRILQDFLSGMQVQDIAGRNGFSVERYLDILRTVMSLQLDSPLDLVVSTEPMAFQDTSRDRRLYPRLRCPVLATQVRDVSCAETEGTIFDISEKGLSIRGIFAEVDEEKTFLLREKEFSPPDPIALTCSCRWTEKALHLGVGPSAGFEITAMSESDKGHLRSWIDAESRVICSQQFLGT